MEQYKDFWISGSATPGPPYTEYWHASGSVCYQRPDSSVVELARFTLNFFKFDDRGVAELFGIETARLVVDISSPALVTGQRIIERETPKSPYRRQ